MMMINVTQREHFSFHLQPIGWSEIVYPMCSGYGAEQKVYIGEKYTGQSKQRQNDPWLPWINHRSS